MHYIDKKKTFCYFTKDFIPFCPHQAYIYIIFQEVKVKRGKHNAKLPSLIRNLNESGSVTFLLSTHLSFLTMCFL